MKGLDRWWKSRYHQEVVSLQTVGCASYNLSLTFHLSLCDVYAHDGEQELPKERESEEREI